MFLNVSALLYCCHKAFTQPNHSEAAYRMHNITTWWANT